MLKLHGFSISNYYNMEKIALLEKGIEFEEVDTRPSQEDDYLSMSPMGKVPASRRITDASPRSMPFSHPFDLPLASDERG